MVLRIAAVSFMNTIPLVEWFHRHPSPEISLVTDLPSRLHAYLRSARADIALLPVFESFGNEVGGIISSACIGCRGPVDSVKFFANGPLEDIRLVRADRGSRSSVALLKVLFRDRYGFFPEFETIRPRPGELPKPGEGHLVIGDLCFAYEKALPNDGAVMAWDLGEMWREHTGLPFVFAAWAAAGSWREKAPAGQIRRTAGLLDQARDFGVENSAELAARAAAAGLLGFGGEATTAAIDYYFRESLDYTIGPDHRRAIREFHQMCIRYGLAPEGPPPDFL